jgi:hypothetical protein
MTDNLEKPLAKSFLTNKKAFRKEVGFLGRKQCLFQPLEMEISQKYYLILPSIITSLYQFFKW